MTGKQGSSPESIVREIKRQTRRKFTAEEKIRIVLEGLRGEAGITDLCRKDGIQDYFSKVAFPFSSTSLIFGRASIFMLLLVERMLPHEIKHCCFASS